MNSITDNTITAGQALRSATTSTASTQTCTPADSINANDCVCLTQQATYLHSAHHALESTPPLDSARIEHLRHALTHGSYQINPQAIAQRMMELDRQLA